MDIELTLYEARIIGALIEKEITTPDQYPLSLNALTNACNQKSNREPVLELDEATVQETLDALVKRSLVSDQTGFGSRTTKYRHRFCNTEFGILKFTEQELGIICALLLRGPQTPGELRTHTNRLCKFRDMQEVESALDRLMERSDGPFVAKLAREPGKRESRYMHLFSGDAPAMEFSGSANSASDLSGAELERLYQLEQRVDELEQEIVQLKRALEQPGPKPTTGYMEA
ncbi:MAG: YceH family protein [Sulfuricella sp.]